MSSSFELISAQDLPDGIVRSRLIPFCGCPFDATPVESFPSSEEIESLLPHPKDARIKKLLVLGFRSNKNRMMARSW